MLHEKFEELKKSSANRHMDTKEAQSRFAPFSTKELQGESKIAIDVTLSVTFRNI
jgi:hypothetical protein